MARPPETYCAGFPELAFRDLTGEVEMALATARMSGEARPKRVSGLLAAAIAEIDGAPADLALVRRLSAGTREWALQQLMAHLVPETAWFIGTCEHCRDEFDLPLSLLEAPRIEPGSSFPVVEVQTSQEVRRFECPNGAHEEAVVACGTPEPVRRLAALCGLDDDAVAAAERFTFEDLERIEWAWDAAAPDVADSANTRCPSCEKETAARIEPLGLGPARDAELLREVHSIASRYHWSEEAILSLPSRRRQLYSRLIESEGRRSPREAVPR
jgi:hypothetical protein